LEANINKVSVLIVKTLKKSFCDAADVIDDENMRNYWNWTSTV